MGNVVSENEFELLHPFYPHHPYLPIPFHSFAAPPGEITPTQPHPFDDGYPHGIGPLARRIALLLQRTTTRAAALSLDAFLGQLLDKQLGNEPVKPVCHTTRQDPKTFLSGKPLPAPSRRITRLSTGKQASVQPYLPPTAPKEIRFAIPKHQTFAVGIQSEAGDYVGAGQSYRFTRQSGAVRVRQVGKSLLEFQLDLGEEKWDFQFAAPHGQPLTRQSYPGAVRYSFQEGNQPGLEISADTRACNEVVGQFTLLDVQYDASGKLSAFAVDFEQRCASLQKSLRGWLRYNSTLPVSNR